MSLDDGARTLVRNGLMQNDLDADNHQILNLDTSNLVINELPTQIAPAHQWFNSYDMDTRLFGSRQPAFVDIREQLTDQQQRNIRAVGTITDGVRRGTSLLPDRLPTLDLIRAPVANVTLNAHKITNLADPVDPQDAVTLHVLNQVSGRNPKAAVAACSTAVVPVRSGLLTIDDVILSDGDRVLLKDQGPLGNDQAANNGIWVAHSGVWTRPTDFDNSPPTTPVGLEIQAATVFVLGGTENAGKTFFQTTDAPVYLVVNTSGRYPEFVIISSSLDISAGPGLQKVGTVISAVGTTDRISINGGIDIDAGYVGQGSITTLGTIDTGTWNADPISIAYGGTGQATAADAINALLPDQSGHAGEFLMTDGAGTLSWGTP